MKILLPGSDRPTRITVAAGLIFLVGVGTAAAWQGLRPEPVYVPGQDVEGVVSQLSREVPSNYPDVTFTRAGADAGIAFTHFPARRSTQLPEDMGSGAAWGDYDGDGDDDLYLVNASRLTVGSSDRGPEPEGRAALYRNEGDGSFTEVTAEAGVTFRGVGMAAAWADYDNDGWPDLFVSAFGENRLYRNLGDGTFRDVTEEAGVGGRPGFWAGVAWGDYDRDGWADLYVTGYVRYTGEPESEAKRQYEVEVPATLNPSSYRPVRNLLYHNQGDGTFTEVAEEMGVADRRGRSLEATWVDFDGDGWSDLYVANDVSDNVLYRNLEGRGFEDVSHRAQVADYRGAMGLAVGDWDGDADPDLFITHWIAQENALYENLADAYEPGGSGRRLLFTDVASAVGAGQVALDDVGWATSFFDYDNDGVLDLFVVNGSTFQREDGPTELVGMRDRIFWNAGDGGFYDVSPVSGPYFREEHVGRGGAVADYDLDGDLDLVVLNHGGEAALLRNDGGNRGRTWLQVRLEGRESNRSALGARLRLVAGDRVQVREVGAQAPYLSQNSRVQHFGLGSATRADTLEIRWPSGLIQRLTDLPANRRMSVVEGEVDEAGDPRPRPEPAGGSPDRVDETADPAARIASDSSHRLYVPNQLGASVSVLDGRGTLLTTMDLRAHGFSERAMPHQVAAEPDGSAWYVTLAGDDRVVKFDGDDRPVARAEFESPGMVVLDPGRDRLYVSRALAAVHPPTSIGVFRASDLTLLEETEVLVSRPHGMAVDTVSGRVHVASIASGRLATVDPERGSVTITRVPEAPNGFVGVYASPDGGRLVATTQLTDRSVWFPNQEAGAVTRVEAGSWTVSDTIRHEAFDEPHGVVVTPDGRTVYVTSPGRALESGAEPYRPPQEGAGPGPDLRSPRANGTVVVIDALSGEVLNVTEVGPYAAAPGLAR
jgi:DNA-binding beta-propeller fold protein YncE